MLKSNNSSRSQTMASISIKDIIKIEKNQQYENIFDISFKSKLDVNGFSSIRCDFLIYPYDRKITSDSFRILPFEEYIEETQKGRESNYRIQEPYRKNIFGILLSSIILLIFLYFKPIDLFSIQSIISLIGAYAIGKEIWMDIDRFLENLTKNINVKWKPEDYRFIKQNAEEIQKYAKIARKKRYGINRLSPSKFNFNNHSNSKSLSLFYPKKFIAKSKDNTKIMSLRFDEEEIEDLQNKQFLFAVEIEFVKDFLLFKLKYKFSQAFHNDIVGSLVQRNWEEGICLQTTSIQIGNLKIIGQEKRLENLNIISS